MREQSMRSIVEGEDDVTMSRLVISQVYASVTFGRVKCVKRDISYYISVKAYRIVLEKGYIETAFRS